MRPVQANPIGQKLQNISKPKVPIFRDLRKVPKKKKKKKEHQQKLIKPILSYRSFTCKKYIIIKENRGYRKKE